MKKIVMLSLIAASSLMADPLVSYPGTKAKGMGGAFTAIANNNSAMYFNPAGMINFDSQKEYIIMTAEGGTGPAFNFNTNTIDDVTDSTFNYFVAAAVTSPNLAYGISAYSLYSVTTTDTRGDLKQQDISALTLSGAYGLTQQMYPYGGALSIGATLGVAFSGGGLITVTTTSSDGSTTSTDDDNTLDQRGFFGAVGIKARMFKSRMFNLDIGVNYRSKATLESTHENGEGTLPVNGMDMPSEFAFGIAGLYLTEYGVFTLTVDKKSTAYEESTSAANSDLNMPLSDYDTLSYGFDFSGPSFQLRAGMYSSDAASNESNTFKFNPDVSGITVGGGITFGPFNLEMSVDKKTYDVSSFGGTKNDEVYASLSLNYALQSSIEHFIDLHSSQYSFK